MPERPQSSDSKPKQDDCGIVRNASQANWLGSWRELSFLTPDTFLKPIKVVSTMFRVVGEKGGETAVCELSALNFQQLERQDWKIIKKHTSELEARAFHAQLVAKQRWD